MRIVSFRNIIRSVATIALSAVCLSSAHAQTTLSAPEALVKSMMTEVLDSIKKDPSLKAGDQVKLNALVDSKILPNVNFDKMTRLAVGPGWRQAAPEQRQKLVKEFRTLLVRTYSGAVANVTDHEIQMKPFRAAPTDTDVLVRAAVVPSKGDPIQLDYRLEKTDAGWKIYDVSVLGVWLVENYKSQFATEVAQGGIDGLIKALEARNSKPVPAAAKAS
jgi:phospholipid transport system substrate-binding protein